MPWPTLLLLACTMMLTACGQGERAEPDVAAGAWERIEARGLGVPVTVGDEVIAVSGGRDHRMAGFAYDVGTGELRRVARPPLPWRAGYTAVGAEGEVVVWGGSSGLAGPPGATYDPKSDSWQPIRESPLPTPSDHTAVWSGNEMLVWGGETRGVCSGPIYAEALGYDPDRRRWRRLAPSPMPGRIGHVAVWTGEEMLVWGGTSGRTGLCEPTDYRQDGAAFDPGENAWSRIPPAPIEWLEGSDAIWTGEEMLVWNGGAVARYDPGARQWRVAAPAPLEGVEVHGGAPRFARVDEAFAWTGTELIIWGGRSSRESVHEPYYDGAAYDPRIDSWSILPATPGGIFSPRHAVWHRGSLYVIAREGWVRFRPSRERLGR